MVTPTNRRNETPLGNGTDRSGSVRVRVGSGSVKCRGCLIKPFLRFFFSLAVGIFLFAGCTSEEDRRTGAKAVDPVCGALVDRSTPYFRNLDGETVYFDSDQCLRLYERKQEEAGEDPLWENLLKFQDR
jgi:YHS domain-containing protein